MKKVFYYLSSLLVLAGCTQENDFFNADSNHAGFKFELTTEDTRTVTDENFKTTFTEGDEVGVFVVSGDAGLAATGNRNQNVKLTYTATGWNPDTEVNFPEDGETLTFYAYYPYVADADPTALAYNASVKMCDFMMAKTGSVTKDQETVHLTFKHQLALADAKVTGGAAGSAELSGIKTEATFNLANFGGDNVMTLTSTEPGTVAMEKFDAKHFRAYIPAQDNSSAKITITSGGSSEDYTTKNAKYELGIAYQYNIVSTLVNLADLPNCYIVKPGESVTFPVLKAYMVWRNITFINNGNLRNDGALGAELIWQDTQSLIPAEGGIALNLNEDKPEQSTITVKTAAGKEGNALVSVTMGGDKVWSWHIWVTDFDPDRNTQEVDNNGDGVTDYVFMDRNLGALTTDVTNPRSVGMYYQGGKNIPYSICANTFPTDGAKLTDIKLYRIDNSEFSYTTGDIWGSDQGQSMRRVLTDPGIFITAGGEPYSWITTDSTAEFLYGPNFWTEEATGEKGVFDPSPEGWMVPAYKNELSPWNMYLNGNTVVTDPTTIYPKNGRIRFDGTFGNVGNVMLFSGSMFGVKNQAFESSADWGQINNYSTANALNVRCVKVQ